MKAPQTREECEAMVRERLKEDIDFEQTIMSFLMLYICKRMEDRLGFFNIIVASIAAQGTMDGINGSIETSLLSNEFVKSLRESRVH